MYLLLERLEKLAETKPTKFQQVYDPLRDTLFDIFQTKNTSLDMQRGLRILLGRVTGI